MYFCKRRRSNIEKGNESARLGARREQLTAPKQGCRRNNILRKQGVPLKINIFRIMFLTKGFVIFISIQKKYLMIKIALYTYPIP